MKVQEIWEAYQDCFARNDERGLLKYLQENVTQDDMIEVNKFSPPLHGVLDMLIRAHNITLKSGHITKRPKLNLIKEED